MALRPLSLSWCQWGPPPGREHPVSGPWSGDGEEEEGAGGSEAQVAACFWQELQLISLGWLWLPVWKRCNAGRKFFKRLNYYCFLCGCLRWCMKKSFKGTWKEICLNSRVVVIHLPPPVGIWPISSGKWLIRTHGFIHGLNIRCHKGDEWWARHLRELRVYKSYF